MVNSLIDFINVLTDNEFKSKIREIPEEFDNKDELLAEIELEGSIPPSMIFFEINGFSSPVDLEEFLNYEFNTLKLTVISNSIANKDTLFLEIQDQVTNAKADLLLKEQSLKTLEDITLNALIKLKIKFCDKVLGLISVDAGDKDIQMRQEIHKKNQVHVFRIKRSADNTSSYVLSEMHKELKKAGYIDCTLREFRKLFMEFGDREPDQTPCPIIWKCNKYNHLAYFIKCINRNFLVQSKSPTNYEKAKHLFYNSVEGAYFSPGKGRFDSRLDPEVKKRFNAIMHRLSIVKKTTFE